MHLSGWLVRTARYDECYGVLCGGFDESEDGLIARGLRRHDPELLNQLIEHCQHQLLRYLAYLTGNRDLARDLFQ